MSDAASSSSNHGLGAPAAKQTYSNGLGSSSAASSKPAETGGGSSRAGYKVSNSLETVLTFFYELQKTIVSAGRTHVYGFP